MANVKVYFGYVVNGTKSDPYLIDKVIDEKEIENYKKELSKKYNCDMVLYWGYNPLFKAPPNMKLLSELRVKRKPVLINQLHL